MEHKHPEQHKKEHHDVKGSCSSGSMQKTSGSCGSADVKKSEHTGSCSSNDKGKKGSCS